MRSTRVTEGFYPHSGHLIQDRDALFVLWRHAGWQALRQASACCHLPRPYKRKRGVRARQKQNREICQTHGTTDSVLKQCTKGSCTKWQVKIRCDASFCSLRGAYGPNIINGCVHPKQNFHHKCWNLALSLDVYFHACTYVCLSYNQFAVRLWATGKANTENESMSL